MGKFSVFFPLIASRAKFLMQLLNFSNGALCSYILWHAHKTKLSTPGENSLFRRELAGAPSHPVRLLVS
jgi:hypothetical protein